ncbi:MAG: DUF2059 domain-containing protein [Elusimicrobiota bacterium]|jgi:hypothetical protein|nr:DUF2059 domain-containing protein [Elusimicrobiota bacterium]
MKKVYVLLFAVCAAFAFSACTRSEKDAHKTISDPRQAAEELLKITHMDVLLDKTMDQVLGMQIQQNPELVPYKSVMEKFFRKYMSYESLKPEIIKIYSDNLSVQELNYTIAFYKTSTGQRILEVLPQITQQSMQLGIAKVQGHISELQQEIEKTRLSLMPKQK